MRHIHPCTAFHFFFSLLNFGFFDYFVNKELYISLVFLPRYNCPVITPLFRTKKVWILYRKNQKHLNL
jgi:hypothetical protein